MAADKPRNVGFAIHGHMWKQQPNDNKSRVIPLQGAISIGSTHNIELKDGYNHKDDRMQAPFTSIVFFRKIVKY